MLKSVSIHPARLLAGALCLALTLATTAAPARVVSQQRAESAGLTRAWFTQAPLNRATQRVVGARLFHGRLYVLTSSGVLQALDAETGVERWTVRLGNGRLPAYGPTIRQTTKHDEEGNAIGLTKVGVITGSTIHVLQADTGAEIYTHKSGGAPATAPAITGTHAFVPVVGGRLIGQPLDQLKGLPIVVASPGTLIDEPVLSANRVIWSTARGHLYGADSRTGVPAYRFDATSRLSGPPSLSGDSMYFATTTGAVYGMSAEKARPLWKNSVGFSVEKSVVALGDSVYVTTNTPTLYAFDANDGAERWRVEGLGDFVSASQKHLYAVNADGALGVLDRASGEPIKSWPAAGGLTPVVNTENDRLYFVSETGLIQCLHEQGLDQPLSHNGTPGEEAADGPQAEAPAAEPADQPAPAVEAPAVDPFGGFDGDAEEPAGDDPFAPGDDEEEAPADDPFAEGIDF